MAACTLDLMRLLFLKYLHMIVSCMPHLPSLQTFLIMNMNKIIIIIKETERCLAPYRMDVTRKSPLKGLYCNQHCGGTVSKKRFRNTMLVHRFRGFGFWITTLTLIHYWLLSQFNFIIKTPALNSPSSFNNCSSWSCSKTALSESLPPD